MRTVRCAHALTRFARSSLSLNLKMSRLYQYNVNICNVKRKTSVYI